MLEAICLLGSFLSILAMAGLGIAPVMASLWILYLSIFISGQTFAGFQWDILLLEAGTACI